jgi:hypothetical protein
MGRRAARSGRLEAREPMPTAPEAIKSRAIGARIATHLTPCREKNGVAKEVNQSRKENNYMKLKELVTKLLEYNMDSEVSVFAANGTIPLDIKSFDDGGERAEGDTGEPRLSLVCFDLEDPLAE